MNGKQVLNIIVVMVVLLNVGALLFSVMPFEVEEAPQPTPAAATLPAALGVYQPPNVEPSLLDSYAGLIAVAGGLVVFGSLGGMGWFLFGGQAAPPSHPPRPVQQRPSHEPTPAPVTRLDQTPPHRPLLTTPRDETAEGSEFDKYGYPEGYADPDGFNWGFLLSGLSVLAVGIFLGTIILIGPMEIVFWLGIKLETMGF